jgi:hypothetical protein
MLVIPNPTPPFFLPAFRSLRSKSIPLTVVGSHSMNPVPPYLHGQPTVVAKPERASEVLDNVCMPLKIDFLLGSLKHL